MPADDRTRGGPARLVWDRGDARSPRGRSLAPGRWRIKSWATEIERDGVVWTISASGKKGPVVTVRAGETVALPIEAKVSLKAQAKRQHDGVVVTMGFQGGHHLGATMLRDGARVAFEAVVRDADDDVIERAPMEYG